MKHPPEAEHAEPQMAIVEVHLRAMMADLAAKGYGALGVCGGIILDHPNGSLCHVFHVVNPECATADDGSFDLSDFMADIADTILDVVDADDRGREEQGKLS